MKMNIQRSKIELCGNMGSLPLRLYNSLYNKYKKLKLHFVHWLIFYYGGIVKSETESF